MLNNNQQLRELFTLPPIQPSASTAIALPQIPAQEKVTEDPEVDAVLWLQKVVMTGNRTLINRALESAKAITTPMEELGRRYSEHIARTTGNTFGAALSSFGFGNLESQAERAIQRAARRHEALSRFGDEKALFSDTPAEKACKNALRGLKKEKWPYFEEGPAAERFNQREVLRPHTLDDCFYARAYWDALYFLRSAWENSGDHWPQAQAHDDYCFAQLSKIRPDTLQEALRAFEHLDEDRMGRTESPAILRNLVTSGWKHQSQEVAA